MKITRSQLKQIIKEEISKVLTEQEVPRVSLEEYEKIIRAFDLKNVKVVAKPKRDGSTEDIAFFKAHIKFVFGDKDLRLQDKDLEFPIRDVLEDNYIYAEQLRPGKEIKSNYIKMIIEPELGDVYAGLDGLASFLREMREIDRIYDEVKRELAELFAQQELDL